MRIPDILPARFRNAQVAAAGRALTFALIAAASVFATGCGTAPTPRSAPSAHADALARIGALEAAGDHFTAAQEYVNLAVLAQPPQRQEYQLRAVRAYLHADHPLQARTLLDQVRTEGLDAVTQQYKAALQARIAMSDGDTESVLALLAQVAPETPPALRAEIHELRAQAYLASGNALESTRERIALDPLLRDESAIAANRDALWEALNRLSDAALEQLRAGAPSQSLAGWMDMALLLRARAADPAGHEARLAEWQRRYPAHPAAGRAAIARTPVRNLPHGYPDHVALMLPLSGPYERAARAVRDGFLAAWYAHRYGGPKPTLRIYDTGASEAEVRAVYRQAVNDGAGLAIGPLTKAAVIDLAAAAPLTVPVIALNQLDVRALPPDGMFQFGLAPEDEAREAAERAVLDGRYRAAVLVPAGEWGTRVAESFRARLEALGGMVVDQTAYEDNRIDFSDPLVRLLRIQPREEAPTVVGETVWRADVDFLFVAALPRHARMIRPQLLYHHAGSLPVYATSHVYGGHTDPNADRDLDGIVFCDMPWTLTADDGADAVRSAVKRLRQDAGNGDPRLYALGVDAYEVIPHLGELGSSSYARFPGATGTIYIDPEGRLHRLLQWARFANGLPAPVDALPATPPYEEPPPGTP